MPATDLGPCTLWTGGVYGEGYGCDGQRYAHRVAYERAHGPIPAGHEVHHRCEVKLCVEPTHLVALTPAQHRAAHATAPACAAAGHPYPESLRPGRTTDCAVCHRDQERARKARRRALATEPVGG